MATAGVILTIACVGMYAGSSPQPGLLRLYAYSLSGGTVVFVAVSLLPLVFANEDFWYQNKLIWEDARYGLTFIYAIVGITTVLHIGAIWHASRYRARLLAFGLEREGLLSGAALQKTYGEQGAAVPSPEDSASMLSHLFFHWFNPLVVKGYKRPLEHADLWDVRAVDRAHEIHKRFVAAWEGVKAVRNPSLLRTFHHAFGKQFYLAGFLKLLHDGLMFVGPVVLRFLVEWLQKPVAEDDHWGYIYTAIIAGGMFLQTILINQYFNIVFRTGMQVRASVVCGVYEKAVRLSSMAKSEKTTGEIVNLMSNDAERLLSACSYLHVIWSAPVQIVVAFGLLFAFLGWPTLVGLAVILLFIPIQGFMTKRLLRYSKQIIGITDRRVKRVNEVLSGIRVIKFYAWEENFARQIQDIRTEELTAIRSQAWWRVGNLVLLMTSPVLVSFSAFAAYALAGNELDAAVVFPSLALFALLRFPIIMLPNIINASVDAGVSIKRIEDFLALEEVVPLPRLPAVVPADRAVPASAVTVRNGRFSWSSLDQPTLQNINLDIPAGSFVMVIGKVAAGKSSLLSALLGELRRDPASEVQVRGKVALCTQQAWIRNATVQENILFGREYDAARYEATIEACSLTRDLEILPSGDQTEIGEKGINLSGGQKARVALARAVYQDADVYLLDDSLSAVDALVGRHIFTECFEKMLKGKTRILVSHQLNYVKRADTIVVMENGEVVTSGKYAEVMAQLRTVGSDLLTHIEERTTAEDEKASDEATTAVGTPTTKLKKKDKLISDEALDRGVVSLYVLKKYMQAAGGVFILLLVLAGLTLTQVAATGTDVWLSIWSGAAIQPEPGIEVYMGVYGGLAVASGVFAFMAGLFAIALGGVWASKTLHAAIFDSILHAPTSFFDTVPLGRILNRFSKDQAAIDNQIPNTISSLGRTAMILIGALTIIAWVTPLFIAPVIPIIFLYVAFQQYYRRTSREVKRLDSVSRSPVYAHFSESLSGTETIRAYDKQAEFAQANKTRVDYNHRAYWASMVANRWLSVRLEMVGLVIVTCAALFVVVGRDSIDAAQAGLSVGYALSITGTLTWSVRMFTQTEAEMNAVERVVDYCNIDQEAAPATSSDVILPPAWPTGGEVQFSDVVLRYRPGLPPVLRGISFTVKAGEKVGVVGRTGAGKSTIILAVFRMVEVSGGTISIDGVDVRTLGLKRLRRSLAIIPQDPVMFSGTVRDNLDPFKEHDDAAVWEALRRCFMADAVSALPAQLLAPVQENGSNFSVGQRQLLCMGRALLRNARLIFMDEATAAVDTATDALIQKTIREAFANCTVFTIAHRLNTIMDSDRVLVLDNGEVKEFDKPATLLEIPDSIFGSMARDSH